jgi:hypothetical protein
VAKQLAVEGAAVLLGAWGKAQQPAAAVVLIAALLRVAAAVLRLLAAAVLLLVAVAILLLLVAILLLLVAILLLLVAIVLAPVLWVVLVVVLLVCGVSRGRRALQGDCSQQRHQQQCGGGLACHVVGTACGVEHCCLVLLCSWLLSALECVVLASPKRLI